jgi:hypothetical protein
MLFLMRFHSSSAVYDSFDLISPCLNNIRMLCSILLNNMMSLSTQPNAQKEISNKSNPPSNSLESIPSSNFESKSHQVHKHN